MQGDVIHPNIFVSGDVADVREVLFYINFLY